MNIRIRRTILNWRWYAAMPVLVLMLPLLIIDFLFLAMEYIGPLGHELMQRIPTYKIREWVQRSKP